MKFFNACPRLAALWLVAAVVVPVHAQSSLPEVIIRANRYEQDLQSAPVAATVLTRQQILDSGARDANEAIRRLTGIASRTDLRGGRDYSLDLRGFGATADQNVVVVIDGIRVSENELATARLSAIPIDSIESIEILRGGASVQWGEGASAGVINVVLRRDAVPRGVTGSATVGAESFGGRQARADLRVGTELLGFDASLGSYTTNGYRANSADRQDTAALGLSSVSGPVRLRLRVDHENQGSRFPGALTFAQYASNPRQTTHPDDHGNFSETRVTLGAEYRLDQLTLSLDVGRRERDTTSIYTGFNSEATSHATQVSPKLGWTGSVGAAALKLLAGADLNRWHYTSTSNFGQNEVALQDNSGYYLSADLLVPGGTRLNAGLRNETVRKRADDPVNFVGYDRPDHVKSWDLGVSQALAAGLNVYARSAQAFRLPNVDENRYLFTALRPQITHDLEAGLKWRTATGDPWSARLFRQNATDEIAYDAPSFSNVNLDPTRRSGLELEGTTALSRSLSLATSLQSLRARFSQGPNSGKEIPLVSGASVALRLGWQIDGRQRAEFGAQYQGSARFSDDAANTCARRIPSNTQLDARYAVKIARWEWSLAASNLTDRQSYSQAYSCASGSLYPDPGRTLKATARVQF